MDIVAVADSYIRGMNMLMNINKLLEDISIRHACKNVGKYAAELEKSLGIKLKSIGGLEFTWSKDFQWWTDAVDAKHIILNYFKHQNLFNVEDYDISGHHRLSFTFKFHPENAV